MSKQRDNLYRLRSGMPSWTAYYFPLVILSIVILGIKPVWVVFSFASQLACIFFIFWQVPPTWSGLSRSHVQCDTSFSIFFCLFGLLIFGGKRIHKQ